MQESLDLHDEAGKENEQTLANLGPAKQATSKDAQYNNKSDLNTWKTLCESLKESRAIENIPANELDLLLSKFFIHKQNGTEYEPGTLKRLPAKFSTLLSCLPI